MKQYICRTNVFNTYYSSKELVGWIEETCNKAYENGYLLASQTSNEDKDSVRIILIFKKLR